MTSSFCSVLSETTVFAGPRTKEEFDRIALPEMVHEWKPDKIETLLRADGSEYEQRCHSKQLGNYAEGTITVIFQWFESRRMASEA